MRICLPPCVATLGLPARRPEAMCARAGCAGLSLPLSPGLGRSKRVAPRSQQQARGATRRLWHSIRTQQGWLQAPSQPGAIRLASPWFAFSVLWEPCSPKPGTKGRRGLCCCHRCEVGSHCRVQHQVALGKHLRLKAAFKLVVAKATCRSTAVRG